MIEKEHLNFYFRSTILTVKVLRNHNKDAGVHGSYILAVHGVSMSVTLGPYAENL